MIEKILRSIKHRIVPRKEFEVYDGSILPGKGRFNSTEFNNNAFYIQTAEKEAKRAIHKLGCNTDSRILEIGCGKGRFAIGLIRILGPVNYTGLDVHKPSIEWCKKYIESKNPTYHFEYLDVKSDRYNKNRNPIDDSFAFNIPDEGVNIVYIWGVFTNMHERTLRIYINDLQRMLVPNGRVSFTAFVEENVP
jgi:cyclopropane fatty-acyl-phospholipid synthase-like methyltransferase